MKRKYLVYATIFMSVICIFLYSCSFIEFNLNIDNNIQRCFLDGFSLLTGDCKAIYFYDFFEMGFSEEIFPKSSFLISCITLSCVILMASICLEMLKKYKIVALIISSFLIVTNLTNGVLSLSLLNFYTVSVEEVFIGYGAILLGVSSFVIVLLQILYFVSHFNIPLTKRFINKD